MTTRDGASPASAGPWMQAVLSELDGLPTAVRTFTEEWGGRELLARAGGAARVRPPSGAVPALVGSSAASIALTLGGALSGRPIAPLGTRLAVAELVPLIKAIAAPVLVADRPNAALAGEVAMASGAALAVFDEFAPF